MTELPRAKKSLGQHWLTDEKALEAICKAGEITKNDTVLEIGPGLGTLTKKLVEKAGQVIAIEKDKKLASSLCERLDLAHVKSRYQASYRGVTQTPSSVRGLTSHKGDGGELRVVQGDILEFDLTDLPADYKIVANIPYYLTSNLIRTISESPNQPSLAVLLVQKEVADRVAAAPGDMSLLSVTAQFYWEVVTGIIVPADLFTPPPKVDSRILILRRPQSPVLPDVDDKQLFRIVKAGFSNRRKTLLNSLAAGLHKNREEINILLDSAGISSQTRPQQLSLNDWYKIYRAVFDPTQLL